MRFILVVSRWSIDERSPSGWRGFGVLLSDERCLIGIDLGIFYALGN